MLTVLETTIRHASDSLELVEGTGLTRRRQTVVDGGTLVVATDPPQAPLSEVADVELVAPPPPADDPDNKPPPPPPDLQVVRRPGRLILWRQIPRDLSITVDGRAPDPRLERPAETPYPLAGRLRFASGRYNPRLFHVSVGGIARPAIPIFQTTAAVTGDRGGIVSARLRHADGKPASWAVVTARLDLPVANPAHVADRTYRAQADRRGELRLALIGLPAPTKAAVEAGTLDRVLTLSVVADPDVSDADIADPDGFATMQLRAPDSAAFAAETRFTIRPGGLIRIASQASDHLSLRPIP